MSSFKFGQNEAASKDFYKQRQVTEIFTIEVNKFVLSNEVSCNNGKLYCKLSNSWRNYHTNFYIEAKGHI